MSDVAPVITIDGPSGAGKGTICQRLAEKLGFHLLDSGALYRLTAVAALKENIDISNPELTAEVARNLDVTFKPTDKGVLVFLKGEDVSGEIRSERGAKGASIVAAHGPVRTALLERQRDFQQQPGLIADGRDMGTTVFPKALLKVFLTASAEERASRRYKQLIERGESANLRALLEDIEARDARDSQRSESPLKAASDAVVIDSTSMSIDDVLAEVTKLAQERLA